MSELLGAYNHDFFESKSLKGALQRNLAKNQCLGTVPSCWNVYLGPFPEVAHVRAGREATRSEGLPTWSPSRDKKQTVYVSIFKMMWV